MQGFEKGYSRFARERELETEHNWNILTPKLWPSALCLSRSPGLLNRSRGVHSAGCWLSLLHLVLLHLQISPTVLPSVQFVGLMLPSTPTRWYGHASTPPQFLPISGDRDMSLPLSLEWPVWSSSNGNNCHAVQRSIASGASVYENIMGFFFTSSHFISQFLPTRFPLITATRMCHFLLVHHLEWHFGRVKRSKHNNIINKYILNKYIINKYIITNILLTSILLTNISLTRISITSILLPSTLLPSISSTSILLPSIFLISISLTGILLPSI